MLYFQVLYRYMDNSGVIVFSYHLLIKVKMRFPDLGITDLMELFYWISVEYVIK